MNKRVVITGMGIISSIGLNIKDFWNNCLKGKTNITKIPDHWHNYNNFNSDIWSPLPKIDLPVSGINEIEKKNLILLV